MSGKKKRKRKKSYHLLQYYFLLRSITGCFSEFILLICSKVHLNIQAKKKKKAKPKKWYFFSLVFSDIFITNSISACIPRSCRNYIFVFVSQSSKTVVKLHLASKQKFIFVFLLSLSVIQDPHYTCHPSARLIRINKCCTDPKGRKGKWKETC